MNWPSFWDGFSSVFLIPHRWVRKRYQIVADWAFTNWDVSPWWIAAQLFPAAIGLHIAVFGVAYLTDPTKAAASPVLALVFTACMVKWWHDALRAHKGWLANPVTLPPQLPVWSVISFVYLWLSVSTVIASVLSWLFPGDTHPFRPWYPLGDLGMLTVMSGFYFCSCSAPTLRKRKESRMLIPSEA